MIPISDVLPMYIKSDINSNMMRGFPTHSPVLMLGKAVECQYFIFDFGSFFHLFLDCIRWHLAYTKYVLLLFYNGCIHKLKYYRYGHFS